MCRAENKVVHRFYMCASAGAALSVSSFFAGGGGVRTGSHSAFAGEVMTFDAGGGSAFAAILLSTAAVAREGSSSCRMSAAVNRCRSPTRNAAASRRGMAGTPAGASSVSVGD